MDAAPWTMDAAPWTIDAAPWTMDAAPWTMDAAPWTMDAAPWTIDAAPWTIDAAPWTMDAAFSSRDVASWYKDAARLKNDAALWLFYSNALFVLKTTKLPIFIYLSIYLSNIDASMVYLYRAYCVCAHIIYIKYAQNPQKQYKDQRLLTFCAVVRAKVM